MLHTLSPTEQHGVALRFIIREQHEVAAAKPVSPGKKPRKEYLKLRVSNYMGREGKTLLRWLAELETAIIAQRLVDPLAKGAFAMSCLGGRARSWAYGHRLTDPTCFSTYVSFKEELKLAFEPHRTSSGRERCFATCSRLVLNVVTNPMDEVTKVVTFMKGLRDGPVTTNLFREYPNTLEAAITLAMQKKFTVRHAKLYANVPRLPVKAEGPEPMDLSYASAVGQQKKKGINGRCVGCGNKGHYARECTAPTLRYWVSSRSNKKRKGQLGAGRPTGNAVTRVYNGHAVLRTAAPSERKSHCEVQDDMPNIVILKVKSMMKRADSLRVLVDSGMSNNFVRQQSLPLLDFEEKHMPRSQLEVRPATGAIVKTEKRVIRARFSYKYRVFVEELFVLDLDDKFDMVLGMTWLARHDPTIDWEKRTFRKGPCQDEEGTLRRTVLGLTEVESLLRDSAEHRDMLPDEIPAELPQDKGKQHEIDLVPETKYCVTRQWPPPREQVKAIDDFFESRRKAGQVRESKSPHSTPTFCVKKPQPQGGWRIVQAYNKLDDATIPAQMQIPRNDAINDSMSKSTIYSALVLRDGFYHILMCESDIPLTAVSAPSGMLWEWLGMLQGLKNAPATFNRCVTHLLFALHRATSTMWTFTARL
ncbi:Retroelement [Phytophthora megakarya]|uniref:Retroelement n=1 Tax=Phytophthora megakarya TaxID=4795 RepID=A0A225UX80_9STRA|nr:Retroelement [Phytophthora megakarya]